MRARVASATQIDPVCGRTPANQLVLVICRGHAVLGKDGESRDLRAFPLRPPWLVDRRDRAFHNIGVEAGALALLCLFEIIDPGVDDGIATEVLTGRGLVDEGGGQDAKNRPSPVASSESSLPATWPSSITRRSTRSGRAAAARNAVWAPID